MTLKQAILQARKQKCHIKCESLGMYEQSAKDLIHWLFVEQHNKAEEYLKATDWDLEVSRKTFHVRYVKNCEANLKSFETNELRAIFLNKFKEDHDANYIDLVFDGVIKKDLLSSGG
jgi:hypothetical protein